MLSVRHLPSKRASMPIRDVAATCLLLVGLPISLVCRVVEQDDAEIQRRWFARVYYRGKEHSFPAETEEDARERATAIRYQITQAKHLG